VESNWSSLGKLATSTREMNFGLRRDTLNDAMSQWNWRKAKGECKLEFFDNFKQNLNMHSTTDMDIFRFRNSNLGPKEKDSRGA
jgi:hypothetical protein